MLILIGIEAAAMMPVLMQNINQLNITIQNIQLYQLNQLYQLTRLNQLNTYK